MATPPNVAQLLASGWKAEVVAVKKYPNTG
jgi:hypothetical protein